MTAARESVYAELHAPPPARAIDRDAVAAAVRAIKNARDAAKQLQARLENARNAERKAARELAQIAGSLAGFVVDGDAVSLHVEPGKEPLVNIRPAVVL